MNECISVSRCIFMKVFNAFLFNIHPEKMKKGDFESPFFRIYHVEVLQFVGSWPMMALLPGQQAPLCVSCRRWILDSILWSWSSSFAPSRIGFDHNFLGVEISTNLFFAEDVEAV